MKKKYIVHFRDIKTEALLISLPPKKSAPGKDKSQKTLKISKVTANKKFILSINVMQP